MQKLTILIIDDSITMSYFLATFFEKKYNVLIYNDPILALRDIRKGLAPDIILTDLEMPQMSGLQLIKAIRGLVFNIPIVVLTANKESHTRIICLELGAHDCITKPFNPIELDLRIMNLIAVPISKIVGNEYFHVIGNVRKLIRAAFF